MDVTSLATIDDNNSVQKFRDILKNYSFMHDGTANYLLCGLELESIIDYSMPARNFFYDALNYDKQIREISANHRREQKEKSSKSTDVTEPTDSIRKLTPGEFLSGFWKDDRLTPIITLVLNISGEQWNGPINLYDMLNIPDKRLLKFIQNYHLNLISPDQIDDEDFTKFCTGVGPAMQFIKHKNDKNMDWIQNKNIVQSIDRSTADFIHKVTGATINFLPNEGVGPMYTIWEATLDDERNKVRNKVRYDTILETKLDMLERLLKKNMPVDFICYMTDLTPDQVNEYITTKTISNLVI